MITHLPPLLVSVPTSNSKALLPLIFPAFSIKNCTKQIEKKKKKKKAIHGKISSKPTKLLAPAPTIEPSSVPTKKVLVPIGFGTEEIETVIITDILRRAGAIVTVASVEDQLEVEAFGGTRLVADEFISSCSDAVFDLIALPGGMPGSTRLRDCKVLQDITRKQAEGKRLYAAICAAPAITLLPWGLITRKQTTCHPAFMDKLPTFWAVKSNLQVSGELTTSRGPGTCFEFAVSLVEQLFGESVAKTICETMLFDVADEDQRREEFNEVSWSLDHAPRVLVPVANGSEEIELVTVIDILRRAKANVTVASVEKSLQILAANGSKITTDKTISAAADSTYDLIIVPGEKPGSERLHKSRILKNLLKEQQSAERIIGAMSSSTAILQKQALLKDKQFTAHPSVSSTLDDAEMVNNSARIVIDGKLITGKGRSASMDFGLSIVGKLFGEGRARSVAGGLVFKYPS